MENQGESEMALPFFIPISTSHQEIWVRHKEPGHQEIGVREIGVRHK
jgi:hypothetical protein